MKNYAKLLVFLFVLPVIMQAQDRLTPELLWKLGRLSDEQVSPDGKTILYGISYYKLDSNKGNRNLYVMPIATSDRATIGGGGAGKQITDIPGSEFNARWRPDGKRIGFLSAKSGSVQLWEIRPDGSDLRQVTDIEDGIGNFAYSPKGNYISFTRNIKLDQTVQDMYPDLPLADARIIDDLMYRHWDSWHDYKYSHVHYMAYADGKVTGDPIDIMPSDHFDSPLNPFGGPEQITWHPEEQTIAYSCKKKSGKDYTVSTNSDVYIYNLESKVTSNLTDGMNGYDMDPVYSPDGKQIIWSSMEKDGFESDKNRIYISDLASGTRTDLTKGWDQTAGHVSWSKDGKKLYFTSPINATYQAYSMNVASKKITKITDGIHNFSSIHEADGKLVGRKCSMSMPYEIYTVNEKTGEDKALTHVNDSILNTIKLGQVRKEMVKTTDGKDMLVWVIHPPEFDPEKTYPALLYCQGGPQSAVSQFFSYRWNFQLMAANDYIIVAPNRRGLPSFGQEWNDQISGDWGGQNMKDYLSAIDQIAKEPYVDNDKLGCVGASYGGYSVYFLAGNHEKRFKTFISHCGLYNLESWYGSTEEMFFANWDLKGAPWDKPLPKSYQGFSPHDFVGNWDTPILVIHGQRDYRVPVTQGMEAFNSAQLRGIPSRFLYYPDEGHWVLSPQNGVLWHRVYFNWLDKYLK